MVAAHNMKGERVMQWVYCRGRDIEVSNDADYLGYKLDVVEGKLDKVVEKLDCLIDLSQKLLDVANNGAAREVPGSKGGV
jgi:hypothetical protein